MTDTIFDYLAALRRGDTSAYQATPLPPRPRVELPPSPPKPPAIAQGRML